MAADDSDKTSGEQAYQNRFVDDLMKAKLDRKRLCGFPVLSRNSAYPSVTSLADLIGDQDFEVHPDEVLSTGKYDRVSLVDIAGSMRPDIAIWSKGPEKQPQIYIEFKDGAALNYQYQLNQVSRYFLHLAGSSLQHSTRKHSSNYFARAVILAAPDSWFDSSYAEAWKRTVEQFGEVGKVLDITLGEMHLRPLNSPI